MEKAKDSSCGEACLHKCCVIIYADHMYVNGGEGVVGLPVFLERAARPGSAPTVCVCVCGWA